MREAWIVLERGEVVAERDADLVVPWWSFTKTAIAALALALVEEGRLSLDNLLPGHSFTLRQLLQHRSGLPDYGGLAAYHDAVLRDGDPWTPEELLDRIDARRLRYEPGLGWAYSNVGYWHIRRLIEMATDENLDCALQQKLLKPMGLAGVGLAERRADLRSVEMGEVRGYHPGWVYHGLVCGPLRAAARLMDGLMRGGFLSSPSLRAMLDAHRLGGPIPGRDWESSGYGLGLMIGRTKGGVAVRGHTGGGPGSTVAVYDSSETDRTAAVFSTSVDENASENKALALLR
ncbi:serine hydrolase domain-containing protein [Microvirga pudoricolor]|uniref:serine hydrolase domain-containing protein n=1 Tax=Microvirga pudoricolor TaxID=2778729 RepID=UPI001951B857|nr:serine hydrolase domain-containing protein [Microvirga pudoricolor]MBM6595670.1 beta-lactamase family protein [Microvirga pudoricolor]